MSLVRRFFRSLLDRELGVLGEEVESLDALLADVAGRLDSLKERIDRMAAREGMKRARAGRPSEMAPQATIDDIKRELEKYRAAPGGDIGFAPPREWQ